MKVINQRNRYKTLASFATNFTVKRELDFGLTQKNASS